MIHRRTSSVNRELIEDPSDPGSCAWNSTSSYNVEMTVKFRDEFMGSIIARDKTRNRLYYFLFLFKKFIPA